MRSEWNDRAREDAHFFVAFGRRDQDNEEFFATAKEVVLGLRHELKRLEAGNIRARRALEIGCGPGRLMRPMSAYFGEIHGVDVADEMIARARRNLNGIPHAHPHHTSGADLAAFADESFDFVYSYAVFQHIPSREVVMQYLAEAVRVLKPGGVIRVQINGLPKSAEQYDTWSGVRIDADEVVDFARQFGLDLMALEGVHTQYMWVTLRKPGTGRRLGTRTIIRRITNAGSSEPVAPATGRFASVSIWADNFPDDCDLTRLQVLVGGYPGKPCYIGPPEADGLRQVNAMMPAQTACGLQPVQLSVDGVPICEPRYLRVIPATPLLPRLISVSDGINLLSGTRIVTGSIKVTIEEIASPANFRAWVSGREVTGVESFCVDPLPPRYEVNFPLPPGTISGCHHLALMVGSRSLGPVALEVVLERPVHP